MKNEFEKSNQSGQNPTDKSNLENKNPQAKQGQAPTDKSFTVGTSGGDHKKPTSEQGSNYGSNENRDKHGFSQYGKSEVDQNKRDVQGENQSGTRGESIGHQPGMNNPDRDQKRDERYDPQASRPGAPGREQEVPGRPEREGDEDLEHLRNPDKTTAPERKEIDPVANSKRESDQDIAKNPSGQDKSSPII